MKKILLWLLVLTMCVSTVACFSLAGCKAKAAAEEEAAPAVEEAVAEEEAKEVEEKERAPITLEYWTVMQEENPQMKAFKRAAEIVKEKYNITVNIVSKGDSGYRELLTASAMSQSGADILFEWSGLADMITSGRQELLLPLNDYLTQEEINSLAGLSACTDPDTKDIYGVIYGSNYIALAYNKDLMEKAGIDYNSFPSKWTYDEFLTVCDKLKKAGITPMTFANQEGYYSDWWHSFFIPTYVDKIEDVIPYYQKTPIYKEPFITFCKNWKDFYDKGYYLDGGGTISIGELWNQFIDEKGALSVTFPSITGMYMDTLGPEKVGLIEFPSMGDGKLSKENPIFGDGIGIANWTKYPEEAVIYLKTLIFEPEIIKMFAAMGNPPVYTKYTMADFPIENPEIAKYFDKHDKMPTFYEGHGFWTVEYSEATRKFCNMLLTGDISIEDYAQEIENAITQ
ncbi:MAG: extracellular solute-binding protein [Actinomycetia bacterium]|nr:extracellular solute-binding protein [Actinomycetes bacterium]